MAILVASLPHDMTNFLGEFSTEGDDEDLDGYIRTEYPDGSVQYYIYSPVPFSLNSTLTGFQHFLPGGALAVELYQLSVPIRTYFSYADSGDATGLTAFMFRGNDSFYSSIGGDDVLLGFAGNDTFVNADATDVLIGGSGVDVLTFVSATSPVAALALEDAFFRYKTQIESVDLRENAVGHSIALGEWSQLAGINLVSGKTLGATSSVTFDASARALAIQLIGSAGNDVLIGGAGNDILTGGAGNDTYAVNSLQDRVTELANGGTDTIRSSITLTLGANIENLELTGNADINAIGNGLANKLYGNSGNNTLNGGAGIDEMHGGAGNDIYVLDNPDDNATEVYGEGVDTAQFVYRASPSVPKTITLADGNFAHIENAIAVGTGLFSFTGNEEDNILTGNASANILHGAGGNDTLIGNAGNDTLEGGAGQDRLDGGTGNDNLAGGDGDDTYVIDSLSDLVEETDGEDLDTIETFVSLTAGKPLAANVENLILLGNAAIGYGNELDNTLTGNTRANILDGAGGADQMTGGGGSDVYIVDDENDDVVETFAGAAGGIDRVESQATYSLDAQPERANIENLTLTGAAASNGTGNGLNNTIIGNGGDNDLFGLGGNDSLTGNAGNDLLDGGAGNDTMIGGAGDDDYVVDSMLDAIRENANSGSDSVESFVTYTLAANVENLDLTGTANLNATGNTLSNILKGNDGNNVLDGKGGADHMAGSLGDDTYVLDTAADDVTEGANGGIDTVRLGYNVSMSIPTVIALGTGKFANIENATALGTGLYHLAGDGGNNFLVGNASANTMTGRAGDDTYVINTTSDIVVELENEGLDTIQSSASLTLAKPLAANVENLLLLGTAALNGVGNELGNALTGNAAANTLDGRGGIDTMIGLAGNDTYFVDDTDDVVTESAGAGADKVNSSATYTLGANIETLVLTGGGDIDGTGNALNNTITGNTGKNRLDGGTGNDAMAGGLGDDLYVVDSTFDRITESLNAGEDTVESSATYTLQTNVDHLTLTGAADINATGNTLANELTGNNGDNVLDGKAGADILAGGLGNDIYVIDHAGDVVSEHDDEGNDTVRVAYTASTVPALTLGVGILANIENLEAIGTGAFSFTGNEADNKLTGNASANILSGGEGKDTLDGKAGADTLAGGEGDDLYRVDNSLDNVVEVAGEGEDTVESTATYRLDTRPDVEHLILLGAAAIRATGNALANTLTGNNAANTLTGLAGNDTLDGLGGNDTMIGGLGDDTYYVNAARDVVRENAGEGTDVVFSSVSYTLALNVEELTLTGSANLVAIGNAGDNLLLGNSGNNVLDGKAGTDTLLGGGGNDTYVVDDDADEVEEDVGAGIDLVQSSATNHALADNVENLTLLGTLTINGTGNELDNIITGNAAVNILFGEEGNDTLNGGGGADILIGNAGNDTYVVDNLNDSVTEFEDEGIDLVQTTLIHALAANVENVLLLGRASINATGNDEDNILTGNSGANTLNGAGGDDTLLGMAGNDTLNGGPGNDELNGGAGTDTMRGNEGNDRYVVDSALDKVFENAGEGDQDQIGTTVTLPALMANIEWLVLLGAAPLNGYGNAGNNRIEGNGGNNLLRGGEGDDFLFGNGGNDTLYGDAGADTLAGGAGNDLYTIDAEDVVIEGEGEGSDTIQAAFSIGTLAANVEKLILLGPAGINGAGNDIDNTITGNAGNNSLSGGGGNDVLIGNAGNDVLNGESGNDVMQGGTGDDTYHIDSVLDVVNEAVRAGTDLVYSDVTYSLGANVEHLTLNGSSDLNATGNALVNWLTGNSGANILDGGAGNDRLDGDEGDDILIGGTGADEMKGGLGNDKYYVDNAGDRVLETDFSHGTDTVYSTVTHLLADLIENLVLQGVAAINGIGNFQDNTIVGNNAANQISGFDGDDILDGGGGADSLSGDFGNDTFIFDPIDSSINGGMGIDTVKLSGSGADLVVVGVALFRSIEVFDLTGTGDNSLYISAARVFSLSDDKRIKVTGDSGDSIRSADQGWMQGADQLENGTTYHTYTVGDASLWVDSDIDLFIS